MVDLYIVADTRSVSAFASAIAIAMFSCQFPVSLTVSPLDVVMCSLVWCRSSSHYELCPFIWPRTSRYGTHDKRLPVRSVEPLTVVMMSMAAETVICAKSFGVPLEQYPTQAIVPGFGLKRGKTFFYMQ